MSDLPKLFYSTPNIEHLESEIIKLGQNKMFINFVFAYNSQFTILDNNF